MFFKFKWHSIIQKKSEIISLFKFGVNSYKGFVLCIKYICPYNATGALLHSSNVFGHEYGKIIFINYV